MPPLWQSFLQNGYIHQQRESTNRGLKAVALIKLTSSNLANQCSYSEPSIRIHILNKYFETEYEQMKQNMNMRNIIWTFDSENVREWKWIWANEYKEYGRMKEGKAQDTPPLWMAKELDHLRNTMETNTIWPKWLNRIHYVSFNIGTFCYSWIAGCCFYE